MPLAENEGKAFQGVILLGMGFTFDDSAAAKGTAYSIADMERLISINPRNAERIKPYLGGDEAANDPRHQHHRYVIDFEDFPLKKDPSLKSWFFNQGTEACDKRRQDWLRNGIVPSDYPGPVAADWPDLLAIVERLVRPERNKQNDQVGKDIWWRYLRSRPELATATLGHSRVLASNCGASPHLAIADLENGSVFANTLAVIALSSRAAFGTIQSRPHEIWARFFSSSLEDRLRYAPSDCFVTFPFPRGYDTNPDLEAAGEAYHDYRAQLMIDTNKGLTPSYNRFHDSYDDDPAIQRLRDLHAEMDRAVLRAYGWDDLADAANPVFLTEETETEFTYQGRLFWRSEFRDEVLARLLDLNRERFAAEANEGVAIATAPDAPHSGQSGKRPRQSTLDIGDGPLFDRTSE
ncbi:hypothetical protein N5A93_19025 [Roseovarius sp. EGI FJ00037]|uniref:type IIL restriction-modification enzyme MmeI n=1 Tax=Roseovarius salincola TaxID=2978479 RepID=UPI0022A8A175|nr:type IIL restriction-modification enzyme MmeI [Roseovarius sp. EGI FJ00037]MCZ0814316.1 hypothetical protein [Roseovarius sp. EGI FJ00037]